MLYERRLDFGMELGCEGQCCLLGGFCFGGKSRKNGEDVGYKGVEMGLKSSNGVLE